MQRAMLVLAPNEERRCKYVYPIFGSAAVFAIDVVAFIKTMAKATVPSLRIVHAVGRSCSAPNAYLNFARLERESENEAERGTESAKKAHWCEITIRWIVLVRCIDTE